jgi:predicted ATPase/class 3 adenylate cyclase
MKADRQSMSRVTIFDVVGKPSGVVSFLFTDVEGSTRRWESDADSMRRALAAHDEVMRGAVAAHDGWLFKHTGDGICAAFGSPRSAVDSAIAAQRELRLPVRMGIATGEAELRGEDYFGIVLNRAARVMSAGHGGQILVDGLTADLLTDVDLLAMGSRRLRDIARPVELFQIRAAGLPEHFPPLKTADAAPGNLRPPTTTLIGREAELADVGSALKANRLVTLTGVGGVGKTRLALDVAARSAPDFPDGVWLIELAAVTDPAAVPDAVAGVLGITQRPGMTMTESVAAAMEGRSRLIMLDNCEHVLNAVADIVEAILAHSATAKILATSREGLRVADEQLWPVPSLDADTSATTLFSERAEAAVPGVALELAAVQEICRRLDGIPLAIELAASRMVSMTVTEVRDRLNDRFRLLVGSRRGLERHQTLRHAVQWSYDLLAQDEQNLLDRCSVFAGGFDLAGACAVAGSDDDFATMDLLDALVRKSLLVADRSTGRTRFSMLETIRQFAEDRLVADGLSDQARDAHARYFAGREADIVAVWDSPRQREAYDWFTSEVANLRTAFRWAADRGDLDTAATIVECACLGPLIEQYEPALWAEELIEPAELVSHRKLLALYVVACQCGWGGRTEDAMRFSERGMRLIGNTRFDATPFFCEVSLGSPYISPGMPDRWEEVARRVLEHIEDSHGLTRASLIMALSLGGAQDEAIALANGLVALVESTGNPFSLAQMLLAVALAYRYVDPQVSLDHLRRAQDIAQASGNRFTGSHIAVTLAPLEAQHGSPTTALDYLRLAIRNYLDSGNTATLRSPLANLAGVLYQVGCYEAAATITDFADDPLSRMAFSEITTTAARLRELLGSERYEALALAGRAMTDAAMANYALEQIDLARAQLSSPTTPT